MTEIIEITDFSDSRLDMFARLTEVELRSRAEPEKGVFIAESPKVITRALDAGHTPIALLMDKKHLAGQGGPIAERCGVPVFTGDEALLSKLTGYPLTRGVLCAMRRPKLPEPVELLRNARRVAVLENIVDHTNAGAVFRSAAALGIDAVLLTPSCCDPLYRRSVRVSMGTVFQVPWTYLGGDAGGWPEKGMDLLRSMGFYTVAMALRNDTVDIDDPGLLSRERLAIVLGTEGDGLSPSTIAECDCTVRIPMYHGVDSLNVASAAAIAFWQLRARS